MKAIIKSVVIFWAGIIPLAILVLMFGPMFAPAKPYEMPGKCDAACMDELLAP